MAEPITDEEFLEWQDRAWECSMKGTYSVGVSCPDCWRPVAPPYAFKDNVEVCQCFDGDDPGPGYYKSDWVKAMGFQGREDSFYHPRNQPVGRGG